MKLFEATFGSIFTRFYLMMIVIGIALFSEIFPLAFLALPIFLSAMLGVKFEKISVTQLIPSRKKKIRSSMISATA